MPMPKKNTAYTFTVALLSTANPGQFQANPTLASGDFQISKDGGAFANLATPVPTIAPAGGILVQVALTATEMNADRISVVAIDQAGNEWGPLHHRIETTAQTIDDIVITSGRVSVDIKAIDGQVVAAQALGRSAQVIYSGTITGAATTTTLIDSGLNQTDTNHWIDRVIIFLTGNLKYQAKAVTAFAPASDQLTFTAATQAPAGGDQYVIL